MLDQIERFLEAVRRLEIPAFYQCPVQVMKLLSRHARRLGPATEVSVRAYQDRAPVDGGRSDDVVLRVGREMLAKVFDLVACGGKNATDGIGDVLIEKEKQCRPTGHYAALSFS